MLRLPLSVSRFVALLVSRLVSLFLSSSCRHVHSFSSLSLHLALSLSLTARVALIDSRVRLNILRLLLPHHTDLGALPCGGAYDARRYRVLHIGGDTGTVACFS